jgi:phosphate transport system permease protein
VLKTVFHLQSAYNLITAGVMLTFMILPTITSLTLNAFDGVDETLISASMSLGNSRTRAIYKICKHQIRQSIVVAIIIAFARAIGETMAISMILQSQGYLSTFSNGFIDFITSNLRTLGALISANMFAEGGGPQLQSLLFGFGLFMFVIVMILNTIAMKLSKHKTKSKYV